jgi:glycyl-tRNA synthetase beta chain
MSTRPLLLEIGCEELPSSALYGLGENLHRGLLEQLDGRHLSYGASRWFATPRRLAVLVEDLAERAPDQERESLGPPVAQAKDAEGRWTRAAEGFASRCGVSPDDLQVIDTAKGERLGMRETEAGLVTAEHLGALVNDAVATLPIAKRMRWGAGRVEFARPVHWVLLLYGDQSEFGPLLGVDSARESFGHRFHAPQPITITHPQHYEAQLLEARVVADFDRRAAMIREQVEALAADFGASALIDESLLREVCSLVEWPVALAGRFDEAFLEVPAEALISSMQSHQKYFPLVTSDDAAALLPRFVTVSNIQSRDPAQIIAGNERVIRPRLADAAFFYRQDLKHTLASQLPRLDDVVFQKDLGTLGDRARRLGRLAASLAHASGADAMQAERAGQLCKVDLVSEMVQEFADMQGIAGAYYARHDGEDDAVAAAIQEHYWPLGAGSKLPGNPLSLTVALADRLDTLVGIFGIGQTPSGSRDPFGLRRAAIAVLRLCTEPGIDLDLREALEQATAGYPQGVLGADTVETVIEYTLDRLPALYEREAIPIEVFRAVRATGVTRPLDLARRVRAVQAFSQREGGIALAAANKRVANILAKLESGHQFSEVCAHLLQEGPEKALYDALGSAAERAEQALGEGDYVAALESLASLRVPVDAFFDGVMVNAEDPALRNNRLSLLKNLRDQFLAIADVSQLS